MYLVSSDSALYLITMSVLAVSGQMLLTLQTTSTVGWVKFVLVGRMLIRTLRYFGHNGMKLLSMQRGQHLFVLHVNRPWIA